MVSCVEERTTHPKYPLPVGRIQASLHGHVNHDKAHKHYKTFHTYLIWQVFFPSEAFPISIK